jgi:serine/threonine-protein kinase
VVHPHVLAIHSVDSTGRLPFLVMPFVDGDSLQERVRRNGQLGTKEVLRIGIQAARGLQAAHE